MAPNESVLVATTIGAVLSGTFIGSSLTLSTMVIPALTVSCSNAPKELGPTILSNATRSWQYIYDIGKKFGPMAGVIGSAAYAYAAYSLPASSTTERRMLYTAAVVNSLLGPFTVAFMTRTNSELIRRSTAARTGKGESHQLKGAEEGSIEAYDTPRLLQRWSKLNAARSIFPFAAAALTATALVGLY